MALTTQTTFLNLTLPVPTQQLGPLWATQLNNAIETIDSHDHTSGKGIRVPTAGLNINADLTVNNFAVQNAQYVSLTQRSSMPSGSEFASSISVTNGNLYFTNSSGVPVQITDGGDLISTPAAVQSFNVTNIASDLLITPTDVFVYIAVDTSVPRTITLPLTSAVQTGRIFKVKDATGNSNTNNITVLPAGTDTIDGRTTDIIDSDESSIEYVSNGITWFRS